MLELRITINISVLKVCFVTVLCFVRAKLGQTCQKDSQQLPGAVREQGAECEHSSQTLFICSPSQHKNQHYSSLTVQPPTPLHVLSLSDEGITVSQNQGLHMKAFLFYFFTKVCDLFYSCV